MVGAEGTKTFDFDNPRSLEKALSEKELHRKKVLKLLLKNVEEILFGWVFLGAHTAQTVSKQVWVCPCECDISLLAKKCVLWNYVITCRKMNDEHKRVFYEIMS